MTTKIYTERDLPSLDARVITALEILAADLKTGKFRDHGTCVLGAGIAVYVKAKYARKASVHRLITAPFQGESGSFEAVKNALACLQSSGVDCFWHGGVID